LRRLQAAQRRRQVLPPAPLTTPARAADDPLGLRFPLLLFDPFTDLVLIVQHGSFLSGS